VVTVRRARDLRNNNGKKICGCFRGPQTCRSGAWWGSSRRS